MPEKNPDIYAQIWAFFISKLPKDYSLTCAVVITFFVSFLRSFLYDPKDTVKRVFAEACLCSVIVYSADPALQYLGFEKPLIIPVGTVIGLFGTSAVRQAIFKYLKSRRK
ncbi:phage holin, lambda family [Vespertiliibacter pulmonis]|uniref:Lambda family phage holin n=1 Tax=Vespertiliibacter pulmonis TaxID=1443036 RepID=A0A3N4WJB4_9PAST|nr:phage holin, lambda family [Vespertiliibacter pulmonis]QLB20066.1 phage holin, lambda family [Vespertiliibacter pulmonis]RPE86030.1 lambda family phage holin [Vespertiliibacter pulmonis]